ncbi:MAG: DUF4080 domain-containing protein [Oscillospiraceae bacterium]|nr:DUF4080 domain-containing protein [Oscillospiraceae bacterium]
MNILLTALSAKHIHKTLAPWCLKAYCDAHVPGCQVAVQEHTINDNIGTIVTELYEGRPDVVGFSCYIWNIDYVVKVATMLKQYLPDCIIVLGGPEVSFASDCSAYPFADYIVQGAGEAAFANLIREMMAGEMPCGKIIKSWDGVAFSALPSPYTPGYYNSFAEGRMVSIKNQLVYYESSRGCPFSCTYCLTSTFCGVQELPLGRVLADIDDLLQYGATCIKFVDRTFNANRGRALEILRYILALETDCTFHFEVAADLFDAELLQVISAMPARRIQFEIGIQSVNPVTLAEINRRMDVDRALQNIRALVEFENCHIHVDLIAGLPFETMDSFAESVNACMNVRPHMLQLGFLKLLKGTKLRENRHIYGYVFNEFPPYEIFRSGHMGLKDMITLRRIEEVIDKFYNSGVFVHAVNYAIEHVFQGAYSFFAALSDFCRGENLRISQKHAYTLLFRFLCQHMDQAPAAHYIKLDALRFNTSNVLPDAITQHRDKTAENEFRKKIEPKYKNIRVEWFEYDDKTRVFIYDERDEMTKAYKVITLP